MSMKIPVSKIRISEENVRIIGADNEINELASSIKAQGLLQPIIVVKAADFDGYNVIAGQRRFLAVKKLGLTEIDSIVKKAVTPSEMKIISLVENVQRKDIDPQDRSTAILTLISYGLSYDEVARRVGVAVATTRHWAGYDAIYPGIKELVSEGKLNQSQALELFRILSDLTEDEALKIADQIAKLKKSKEKDKAIRILKNDPDLSFEELSEEISREVAQKHFRVTLTLSSSVSTILKKKARERGIDVGEFVREIVEEYLENE